MAFYDGAWANHASNTQLVTNTWYHMVYILEGTNMKIYQNNLKVFDNTLTPVAIGGTTTIGAAIGQTSNNINALLDEFGIWSRAISEAEVSELYNSGNGLTYPFGVAPEAAPLKIFDVRFG